MTDKRLILALAPLALLAGCGESASEDDGRAASGEVLEGTISDAMLPLDRVRSQPPLMDPRPRSPGAENAGDGEGGAAENAEVAPPEGIAPTESSETTAAEPAVADADEE